MGPARIFQHRGRVDAAEFVARLVLEKLAHQGSHMEILAQHFLSNDKRELQDLDHFVLREALQRQFRKGSIEMVQDVINDHFPGFWSF